MISQNVLHICNFIIQWYFSKVFVKILSRNHTKNNNCIVRWPRYKPHSHIEQALESYRGNQNHWIETNVWNGKDGKKKSVTQSTKKK